jgi:hypothetical protein
MNPFVFYSTAGVPVTTRLTADDLRSLLSGIRRVPGSAIFYHLHHSLLRRHVSPEAFANDFALWVFSELHEAPLAERLAAIDPFAYPSVREVRQAVVAIIADYIGSVSGLYRVGPEAEFRFLELRSFVFPTGEVAPDLATFARIMENLSLGSLFYHRVEAPLRLGRPTNDFATWLATTVGETELAAEIERLSPFAFNLLELRARIAALVRERVREAK